MRNLSYRAQSTRRCAPTDWTSLVGLLAALTAVGCGSNDPAAKLPDAAANPDAGAQTDIAPAPSGTGGAGAGNDAAGGSPDTLAPPKPDALPPPALDAAPPKTDVATPPPPPADAAPGVFVPHPSPKSVAVYDTAKISDFYLTFPPGAWDTLVADLATGDARYVPCSLTFEGETFAAASCRRKGNKTDREFENKPQLIVRFNFTDKTGRFRGLRRLVFEAFDGADAPLRDRLGMWLMREAGLDASRVAHARLWKDGAQLGLYMNIEAIDQEFLEDHFGPDAQGNLWEKGTELETNEAANNRARLTALEALTSAEPLDGDHTTFFATLPTLMDIHQVLRLMAAETVLVSDDNYSNGGWNYYLYEHPRRGFMVLPWDLDTIFSSPVESDPFAYNSGGPIKLRLLINQNPAWRSEFIDQVVQIRDQILTRLPAELDAVWAQIQDAVKADPNPSGPFSNALADYQDLKARVPGRIAFLKQAFGR